jgi:hypothetical protein
MELNVEDKPLELTKVYKIIFDKLKSKYPAIDSNNREELVFQFLSKHPDIMLSVIDQNKE